MELTEFVLHEHLQLRTMEQIAGLPVPCVMKESVEAVRSFPREHIQQRTMHQIVDGSATQIVEEVESLRFVPD